MFDIGIGEVFVLLVVALLVFGPDRLPEMAKQAAGFVRDLRMMVANARKDLSGSVGDLGIDEEDLKTLSDLRNPKSFVRQKVLDGIDLGLDDDDDSAPARRTNGSRPPARSSSYSDATSGERVGETVDVPPPSADAPPAPEEHVAPPPLEDTPAAPAPAGAEPAPPASSADQPAAEPSPESVAADTARSPRFDPDTT